MAMARRLRELRSGKPREPAAPMASQYYLRAGLPAVGMTYRSGERLMHDTDRDKRVAELLQAAVRQRLYPSINHAFTSMFRVASPLVSKAHSQGLDLWDALPLVQGKIGWARNLPQPIFFELFTCLVEARDAWQRNSKSYSWTCESDPLVREIDTFRQTVGDGPKSPYSRNGEHMSWILVDAVFFNELASGFNINEDEDEDVEMHNSRDVNAIDYFSDTDEEVAKITPPLMRLGLNSRSRRSRY
ncbi:hypothetical protein GGR58DRAFT_519844 [Xylaria digitata]|nr:hypothetical protein GGR58DRAFT_519844 [Xylaria digitata]